MKVNNRWDDSTSDKCPLCDKFQEDSDHVFICQFRTTIRVRDEHVRKLTTALKKLHTNEKIIKAIIGSTEPDPNTSSIDPFQMHLHQAIQAQTSIGWGNTPRGYIATKWSDLQEMHYKTINVGRRCENEIIDNMTKISKNIWKERSDIVKLEDDHTKDARTREAAFLLACELRKEEWKIPSANGAIINIPKSFFYDSNITQILNWEQSVSKALKAAMSLEYNIKSKITSWITLTPSNLQQQHHQVTNQTPTNQTSVSQQSLLTYLTRPTKKKV